MKKSDTFASIMPKVIDIMATRRVFFAIIAPAEITAGGEGIAMSDKPAQQLRRQKYIPEFPPRRGERFPPMWGFIPHVRGRFRSNAYRDGISMDIDSSGHLLFLSSARKISTNIYFYFSISIICSNFAADFAVLGKIRCQGLKGMLRECLWQKRKITTRKYYIIR
ncbi:hypothetical protein [Prevotella pectinovora]|uniref:hypothetical protein n=1 Tax=Prevotella pectinovora TaxID=1602169 RepID=UPI0005B6D5B2|nr:hypothetical protein [Prevotella pectinovora]KIP57923.1 hypothetical protein ST41_05060 [Prevotella pectinovora]